MCISQ